MGPSCEDVRIANRFASLKGGLPNIRVYSRLNCEVLLYPTVKAELSAVLASSIIKRLASNKRRRF